MRIGDSRVQLPDQVWAKQVFDVIGIAVDMAGGDVGVEDQVGFPQAMITNDRTRLSGTGCAEAMSVQITDEETVAAGGSEQSLQSPRGPGTAVQDRHIGDDVVEKWVGAVVPRFRQAGFEKFVDGPEQVMATDSLARRALYEETLEDSSATPEQHAE